MARAFFRSACSDGLPHDGEAGTWESLLKMDVKRCDAAFISSHWQSLKASIPQACDDGNMLDGDGCSSNCVVEMGWTCEAMAAIEFLDVASVSGCSLLSVSSLDTIFAIH